MAEADIKKVIKQSYVRPSGLACSTLTDRCTVQDFFHHVNMSIKELEAWLDDELSMNTGLAADDGEPKGA